MVQWPPCGSPLARSSFVYPGYVWWHCFVVWWRHRLPYSTSSTKTNDKSQHSSLIWQFSNRVSAMPKAPQRLRGKCIEFDETSHCPPFKKLLKINGQRSSKNTSTSSWTTSQRLENIFYRSIRQWARSYSQSESPSVAESTTAATASRSDIHDDDALSASTVIGTGQTGSALAEPEVEEETDLFLKTVANHYGACYVYLITW